MVNFNTPKYRRFVKYAACATLIKYCVFGFCAGTVPVAKGRLIDNTHKPAIEERLNDFWRHHYLGDIAMESTKPFREITYMALGE